MTLADQLEMLRSTLSNCQLVALGDAEARLILKAAHATSVPRETLDHLCEEATTCFATADMLGAQGASANEALVLTERESRVYLRANNRTDFLCVVSALSEDPDAVTAQGLRTLHEIAGAA